MQNATKLHLGCGPHILPGWINYDIEPGEGGFKLDLRGPLPQKNNSVDYVFSEHFIEHLERVEAVRLLTEVHRVLKPGGFVRISTPSLGVLVRDYYENRLDRWQEVWRPRTKAQLLNEGMRNWGHRFLYDLPELYGALTEAGFRKMAPVNHRRSYNAALCDLEVRPFFEDLIVEAEK